MRNTIMSGILRTPCRAPRYARRAFGTLTAAALALGPLGVQAAWAGEPTIAQPPIPLSRLQPAAEAGKEAKIAIEAIDGDTIRLGGERLRLAGIDAPELGQTCDGARVGQWAREVLANLLSEPVECAGTERDRYGRRLVVCFVVPAKASGEGRQAGGLEINRFMVASGWAFAYWTRAYALDEAKADGMVQKYHCERPSLWRRTHDGGKP